MKKQFLGGRIRRLRDERSLTQAALAATLGLSPSYLNQIENNQRPVTLPILLRLNTALGVELQLLSDSDEARLLAGLRDAFSDPAQTEDIGLNEMRDIIGSMPVVGRSIVALHHRYRMASERAETMAASLGLGEGGAPGAPLLFPHEQVRDFFYDHHNHFPVLDNAAEVLAREIGIEPGTAEDTLRRHLERQHHIRVVAVHERRSGVPVDRYFSREENCLYVSDRLSEGQRSFQMATQIAFLEMDKVIEDLAREAAMGNAETHALARIGLASYFAGALLMPYDLFLGNAEDCHYDIEALSDRFQVGFETICHRLSTLQRRTSPGVPFFFIRVDRAGNISKRQSATDFHFSRTGGTCPLWNVYEAFSQPGRILTQVARMPDGRTYLWIARTVTGRRTNYRMPEQIFSVALGCDVRHAHRLVYSSGIDLKDTEAATPIGIGCKLCERKACPQRAFPSIGKARQADETLRLDAPYADANLK